LPRVAIRPGNSCDSPAGTLDFLFGSKVPWPQTPVAPVFGERRLPVSPAGGDFAGVTPARRHSSELLALEILGEARRLQPRPNLITPVVILFEQPLGHPLGPPPAPSATRRPTDLAAEAAEAPRAESGHTS